MEYTAMYLDTEETKKLLASGNPLATHLYIYIRNGNSPRNAAADLLLSKDAVSQAFDTLKELGLYKPYPLPSPTTKPRYGDQDVLQELSSGMGFKDLLNEVQHRMGRILNTEEMKILLNIRNYLGLSAEVICMLVNYCISRAKQRGQSKMPSLYQIEKEAYHWSDEGIETTDDAISYIQKMNDRQTATAQLMQLLQIRGRNLTAPEAQYTEAWLQMGFSFDMLALAYEKTCINTGGMSWTYMNKVLTRWKEEGYRTPDEVKKRNTAYSVPGKRQLDADEVAAIQRMLQEN